MLCQNFQTEAINYRTTAYKPNGGVYNQSIPDPYVESLANSGGIWEQPSTGRIWSYGYFNAKYHPGWVTRIQQFNGFTGAYIEDFGDNTYLGLTHTHMIQDAQGYIWRVTSNGISVSRHDPDSFAYVGPTLTDTDIGFYPGTVFLFDTERDRALFPNGRGVDVRKYSDWSLLSTRVLPAAPECIVSGNDSCAYILLADDTYVLYDYINDRLLQYTRLPVPADADLTAIAWSKRYQRLLLFVHTPDNPDGSPTAYIAGYRNRPIATRLIKPIPLAPPRSGQQTPLLIRQIGDLGEGIPGLVTASSTDTAAELLRTSVALDGEGDAVLQIAGTAEASETITVQSEASCPP